MITTRQLVYLSMLLFCCLLTQPSLAALSAEQQTESMLQKPAEATLYETAAGALGNWCRYATSKPALLLLSHNPFLQPTPIGKRDQAIELIRSCDQARIVAEINDDNPDPTILPNMSVSAALEAGFFSQLIWVLPIDTSQKQLSAEAFQQKLVDQGIANQAEANTFIPNGNGLTGILRGIPVHVIPFDKLYPPPKATLVHLDMSFFPPLYQNEIKTPLFQLIFQTLQQLQQLLLTPLSISLSQSNSDGGLPLTTRFVGTVVQSLFQKPEQLSSQPPLNWQRHRDALYLDNFFKNEETLTLYQQMEKTEADNPDIKYALYHNLRKLKKGTAALEMLASAVILDPIYALEYLPLAQTAFEQIRPDEALRMLDLALATFPQNPFIRLQKAELLTTLGQKQAALKLLHELKQLKWSDLYYSRVPQHIDRLIEAAQQPLQHGSMDATVPATKGTSTKGKTGTN